MIKLEKRKGKHILSRAYRQRERLFNLVPAIRRSKNACSRIAADCFGNET